MDKETQGQNRCVRLSPKHKWNVWPYDDLWKTGTKIFALLCKTDQTAAVGNRNVIGHQKVVSDRADIHDARIYLKKKITCYNFVLHHTRVLVTGQFLGNTTLIWINPKPKGSKPVSAISHLRVDSDRAWADKKLKKLCFLAKLVSAAQRLAGFSKLECWLLLGFLWVGRAQWLSAGDRGVAQCQGVAPGVGCIWGHRGPVAGVKHHDSGHGGSSDPLLLLAIIFWF